MSKVYTTSPDEVIDSALTKLEAYIRPTYGAAGKGILVDTGMYQKVLDDGFMVIDEFELSDPLENAVIKFVREASAKANKRAGDGTTTATLGMIALYRGFVKSGKSIVTVNTEIALALSEARDQIAGSIRTISSRIDLFSVALNAYKDHGSAGIVSEVVEKIGPDGFITVEESESLETKSQIVTGMNIPSGFFSPYMANDEGKVEIKDPAIILTTRRIMTNKDILPIIEKIMATGKRDILIVCESLEGEAMTTLVMNRLRGILNIMVVKAPYADNAKKDFLEDLAIVTGATIADDAAGVPLENLGLGALGHAAKSVTTNDNTLIVDGQGIEGQLTQRIETVRNLLEEQPNNDAIKRRLARLTGGIAVIKVGGSTEAEIKTKKAKVEDAVAATQLAYKTGVVKGGAQALLVNTHSTVFNDALAFPRQVLEDNGMDAITEGVEDAFGVVESALDCAVSMATLLLNTGGIITKVDGNSSQKSV